MMNMVERNNRQHELYRTSKRSAEKAEKIARELDHPYVGTEHLLLAFMRVCTGVAGQILSANGVEEANLYKIVDELISPVGEVTFQEKPKRSPRLEYTLEESKEEAIRFQSEAIGTEHMLLAILREPDSVATRILLTLNVNIQKNHAGYAGKFSAWISRNIKRSFKRHIKEKMGF